VLLSDRTLLDRTPVESSWLGFPMSQFDKDDVEELGLLKLDVLGIRMQSAMSYAVQEVARVDGVTIDVDAAPRDDPATFALVQSTRTLGCFQIESPGQRELVGKFAPETFEDLIVDISLFRPGPVKSDMVRPFLEARQGWKPAVYPHPDLEPVLAQTHGVVVFHEQVLQIVSVMTGCSLAEADEVRRALGDPEGQDEVRVWFVPTALAAGYEVGVVERVWEVLKAFGSFGFCKAHAAAFALPTYQSAWLKAHHPAAFLAGVLTHDPGMYPKRLILDDARQLGIAVLGLDVNRSDASYRVERVGVLDEPPPAVLDQVGSPAADPLLPADLLPADLLDGRGVLGGVSGPRSAPSDPRLPDGRGYGIRIGLAAAPCTAASVTRAGACMSSHTASSPPLSQASCSTGNSQQPTACMDTPRGPVRRTSPCTTSSQEWKTVVAQPTWASSKKVASSGPVASSSVTKMTRRPERIGGVWVATFTPATSTSCRLRQPSRSRARVVPSSARNGA
jgi:error-prone DNA polymerase